jgi:hypothetical protein
MYLYLCVKRCYVRVTLRLQCFVKHIQGFPLPPPSPSPATSHGKPHFTGTEKFCHDIEFLVNWWW